MQRFMIEKELVDTIGNKALKLPHFSNQSSLHLSEHPLFMAIPGPQSCFEARFVDAVMPFACTSRGPDGNYYYF